MSTFNSVLIITLIIFSIVDPIASQSKKRLGKTEKGAIIGSSSGAVIGGIIGNKSNNTVLGAILGAVVGGAVGTVIGNKMDNHAKKISDELGEAVKVERIGEGIKVTFDSKMLFEFGKSYLNDDNKADLKKFAGTLSEYPDTDLYIVGHTDDVGSRKFNNALSIKRSTTVSNFLDEIGVSSARLRASGFGENQPIVSNSSPYNRSLNRRVEIAIYANDKMKAEAKAESGM